MQWAALSDRNQVAWPDVQADMKRTLRAIMTGIDSEPLELIIAA